MEGGTGADCITIIEGWGLSTVGFLRADHHIRRGGSGVDAGRGRSRFRCHIAEYLPLKTGEEWMWSGDLWGARGGRYEGASLLVSQDYLFLEPENEECINYIVLLIRRYRMLL
jgi:hypothetical protein